ncbi:MAG: beta-galactosidase [Terrimicrobiaceae bacterium]
MFAVGIFSWSNLEPLEGVFSFDWLDRVMDELAEDGCRAILATPSAARPPWLARKHPEVMRVGRNRQREEFGTRHNFCWSAPVFREKVHIIDEMLARRYGTHPAMGLWHISNELGGSDGNGECFCPLCLARWHQWLEARHGTVDALNDAWWSSFWSHRFTCWEEINPSDPTLEACALDWSRFVNAMMCEWVEFEAGIVRPHSPGVPVTTNFMGLQPWIDYGELAGTVDVVSDDQYPCLFVGQTDLNDRFLATAFKHDLQRNYHPDRPFFLMESCPETPQWHQPQALKHEFLHRAEMLQAIGHGAEGTCYFQWRKGRGGLERLHGAVVDHEGSERTRTFGIVSRLSETYQMLTPVIGTGRSAQVAVLYDHDTRRMLELGKALPNGGHAYVVEAQEHYRVFWRHGIPVDVLDSRRRWEDHHIVIAPVLYLLHDGVADRIRRFVQEGGIFVATSLTACVDVSARCLTGGWPGGGLRDVFGLWDEETDRLPEGASVTVERLHPGGRMGHASRILSMVHPEGADVIARFGPGPFIPCGGPAILRHPRGSGTAYYLAGQFDRSTLGEFYRSLMDAAGLLPPLGSELPEGVVFASRGEGDREFWFLSNTSDRDCFLDLPGGSQVVSLLGDHATGSRIHLARHSDGVWQVSRTKPDAIRNGPASPEKLTDRVEE